MAGKTTKKAATFEAGLEKLEAISEQMEIADLPLEELMKLYEEGLALSHDLEARLAAARGKMQEIQKGQDGKPVAVNCTVEQQLSLVPQEDEV